MTRVRLSCAFCGDIDLPPSQVRLITWAPDRGLAHFHHCDEDQLKPTNAAQIKALTQGGVTVVEMPTQPVVDGPPLCADDLIDLHFELDRMEGTT